MNTSNQTKRTAYDNAFPKTCAVCGTVYDSHLDFIERTRPLQAGTLSQGPKDSVLSYRNCHCGSTITIKVEDMRDYSEEGVKQREEFKKRLSALIEEGMNENLAIEQIKKEMGLD